MGEKVGWLAGGGEDDRHVLGLRQLVDPRGHVQAIAARHGDVQNNQVRLVANGLAGAHDGVVGDDGGITFGFHANLQGHGDSRVVFDDEYGFHVIIGSLEAVTFNSSAGGGQRSRGSARAMARSSFSRSYGFSKKPAATASCA